MTIAAALDLSGREAALALRDENSGKLLCDVSIPMSGREASGLLKWLLARLEENNLSLDAINSWTVGSGPGSFTGLRLASALVMGLSWEKPELKARSLPSAFAIAAALPGIGEGQQVAVLYDGHRGEILVFGAVRKDGEWRASGLASVLTPNDDAASILKDFNSLATLERDEAAIRSALPQKLAPKLHVIDKLRASFLLDAAPSDWTGKLTELVYIRPAVFVEARIPRENVI